MRKQDELFLGAKKAAERNGEIEEWRRPQYKEKVRKMRLKRLKGFLGFITRPEVLAIIMTLGVIIFSLTL